ncbi:MAG: hypothetical protein LBT82_03185 [Oscillospiraceae bacterium]|nr:hypothetical protein [Oscillospiraceae bacterium]
MNKKQIVDVLESNGFDVKKIIKDIPKYSFCESNFSDSKIGTPPSMKY